MNEILTADFALRFPEGPEIRLENLRVPLAGGRVTVLFGASGSGKTTALRCLAGLARPDSGSIHFGTELWFEATQNEFLLPRLRRVGFVPQDYALFPHLSVTRNVAYGLAHLDRAEQQRRVTETLRWLGLEGLEHRRPLELSGGQQQRVALARALVGRPRLLLLDEPLAALDTPTRLRLRHELRGWLRQAALPTVLVTHDRTEALALGDEVVVLHEGRNIQQGPPQEVFSRPASLMVAQTAAIETIQPGRVLGIREGLATILVGTAQLTALADQLPAGITGVYACIHAGDVMLTGPDSAPSSARNHLRARVRLLTREGPMLRVELDCGFPLTALVTQQACAELGLQEGSRVTALLKAPQIHLIPFAP